jgi:hypothetical protein
MDNNNLEDNLNRAVLSEALHNHLRETLAILQGLTLNSMATCSTDKLVENQALLKAYKNLSDRLLGDVEVGKQAERRVAAEHKQIVEVNGKKQIR